MKKGRRKRRGSGRASDDAKIEAMETKVRIVILPRTVCRKPPSYARAK
jgi:hypothetical protein